MRPDNTKRNERVIALYRAGRNPREIASALGLTKATVNGVLRSAKETRKGSTRELAKIPAGKRVCLDGSPGQEPIGCLYIAQDPCEPGWSYCQAKKQDGLPYCPHHCAVCYRPLAVKTKEAA